MPRYQAERIVLLTSPANVPSPVKPITILELVAGLAVTMLRLI
jgi:hypothetical protein